MDKVIIKDLVARGIIGVHKWERQEPQEILINLTMFTDLRSAGESDNLEDSINYQTVAQKVLAHTESAQRFTVEALASDIARLCLEIAKVWKVQVRVEKTGALPYTRAVGVEIERERGE